MAAQSMGPHVVVLLAFVCVAGPPIACAVLLWRLDPSKRDLINHTVVPLALGASVPPLVTRIAQAVFGLPGSVFPPFLQSYAPVPLSVWTGLIEEAAKAVVVLAVFAWMRRGFVDALDGLVLGGIVGAGMALAQGLVYVEDLAPVAQIARITPGTLLTTGAVGLTQCAFTAVFGASLGYAREAPRRGFIPIIGFAAAALYHMAYVALGTLAGAPQLGTAAGAAGIAREVADWIGVMFVAAAAWWARSGPRAARDPAGLRPDRSPVVAGGRRVLFGTGACAALCAAGVVALILAGIPERLAAAQAGRPGALRITVELAKLGPNHRPVQKTNAFAPGDVVGAVFTPAAVPAAVGIQAIWLRTEGDHAFPIAEPDLMTIHPTATAHPRTASLTGAPTGTYVFMIAQRGPGRALHVVAAEQFFIE